ncbi:DUF2845 domain-containing protein [Legionella sp. W05-934-2]|uniref:DUF2845 domain-containing protein n=1 Tax=Legionella sp. W05-934-2 TaxID=1198649 RepID=UPI003462FA80
MNRIKASIVFLIGMSLANGSFASEPLLTCPKTYQNVLKGDSEQAVLTKCGPPVSKNTQQEELTKKLELEIWSYRAAPTSSNSQVVSFVFSDNSLYELNVAGSNVSSMSMCKTFFTVKVSTKDDVKKACGMPKETSTQTRTIPAGTQEVTTWVYQPNPYQPEQKFKFVEGKLVSVE